jgi:hypothetical protein
MHHHHISQSKSDRRIHKDDDDDNNNATQRDFLIPLSLSAPSPSSCRFSVRPEFPMPEINPFCAFLLCMKYHVYVSGK